MFETDIKRVLRKLLAEGDVIDDALATATSDEKQELLALKQFNDKRLRLLVKVAVK